ncbi:MAG: FAD-binding oxidoreductase [Chloroflexi bacterium]|nr:FAD-binding oxidoreductase [Anaerolineaceae bacterium]NMB87383.1 FAD-binding oxidoreductase [Chloroflexota bacterium]
MPGNTSEFLIIGGGFAGTAIAYYLARAGSEVRLLEANRLGSGTSGACAGRAQVIDAHTEDYLDLLVAGFRYLSQLPQELDLDLEWELPGHLTLLRNAQEWQEYSACVERLRARDLPAEMLDRKSLQSLEPQLYTQDLLGASYSLEGHLNPFRFCLGFAHAARQAGAAIETGAAVTGWLQQHGHITGVQTAQASYSAGTVILACGAWSGQVLASLGIDFPMKFSHAEAVITEPLPRLIHHHIGMTGFYEVVHGQDQTVTLGLGQHPNGTLLISNAIEKSEQIDPRSSAWGMPAIARLFAERFPDLRRVRFLRTWSAPSPYLPDYLPALGWLPGYDNLFVTAGFHLAIPTIPLLSRQAAAWLVNGESPDWQSTFSPRRLFSPSCSGA